jgi:phosphatidylserine decarboxylase
MSIAKEGYPFIFVPLASGGVLALASRLASPAEFNTLGLILYCAALTLELAGLFCAYFFRDPDIPVTQGEGLILSPCNGKVMEVAVEETETIIRIFLSIFDVHIQRSPATGIIASVKHIDGKFHAAWNPKAQSQNEQNRIIIEGGATYQVRQIAGFLARRCVCWVKPGDLIRAGDKIGMIKFSSQVDLHLPRTITIQTKPGDKVRAGISIVGRR